MATIKIPGIGEVPRGYAIAGAAAVVAGIFVYSRRQKAAAAAAAAAPAAGTAMVTDPAGNQCAATDPASGYCPGTTEDEQYQQQAVSSIGEGYNPYYGGSGSPYGYTTSLGTVTPASTAPSTNAQWVTAAEAEMGNTSTIQSALGYVLGGIPVTQDQQQIFQEAVGLIGPPPQSYPAIQISQPSSQGTSPAAGSVAVPYTTGLSAGQAHNELVSAGLQPTAPASQKPNMKVSYTSPQAGTVVAKGTRVTIDTSGYV